jgi:hypothetical protein
MLRFFAVRGVLLQDPALPTGARSNGGPTCEFCSCGLAADGAVLRTSQRAKDLAKIEITLERAQEDLAKAQASVTELTAQLAAAVAKCQELSQQLPAPAARRGGLHFDDA